MKLGLVLRTLAAGLVLTLSMIGTAVRSRYESIPHEPSRMTASLDEDGAAAIDMAAHVLGPVMSATAGTVTNDVRVNEGFRPGELASCHLQSEPSIAAYQTNVYVAFNDTRNCNDGLGISGLRRSGNGFARSTDGGQTFDDLGPLMPSGEEIQHLDGDPALAVDSRGADAGTIYYSSLSGGLAGGQTETAYRGVAVGISRDGGNTFEWHAASGIDRAADKPWIAVDNSGGPHDGNVYVTWSHTTSGARAIRMVRSEDGGRTWSAPIAIETGAWMSGPRPAVGPDGEVHVIWLQWPGQAALHYTRSSDGGRTFTSLETAVQFLPIGDTGECPGFAAVKGRIRLYSMPSVAVDVHGSANPTDENYNPERGRVYVTWQGQGASSDASDVWLISRESRTGVWSPKVRVNTDATTNDQFLPEVVVPSPGEVFLSWADRREDSENLAMRQYARTSTDAGRTFSPDAPVSDVSFPPPFTFPNSDPFIAPCYAGDYNGLFAAEDGTIYAAWSDQRDDLLVNGPGGQRHIPDPNVYFRRIER